MKTKHPYIATLLAVLCLIMSSCFKTTSPQSSSTSPENGIVKPTARNIVNPDRDNLVTRPEAVLIGLTPDQLIFTLGHPKEVKFVAVDSTEVELWTWYYTYEWPERHPSERWAILCVRFSEGKVREAYWLPSL